MSARRARDVSVASSTRLVEFHFTAAGTPGTHLIDLYPGIYKGPSDAQQLYRLAQLTYADDHPGNKIPALRFAVTVTES